MYLFLLGRDKDLSKLELAICLKKNNINYSIVINSDKYLILDIKKEEQEIKEITKDLSGIVRIAHIYFVSKKITADVSNRLNFNSPKKFNYTISSIDIDEDELGDIENILKINFKEEKVKAVYKKPVTHTKSKSKSLINRVANPDNFFSWKIENGLEIFVIKGNNFYFGKTIFCPNPRELIFKDKNRPAIKEKYNTSFRLVSIMINLLNLNRGKTLVDPFCGTGTFLIEGLIKGYDVIGIDVDFEMVDSANKNVSWAVSTFKLKNKYKIIRGSSVNTKFQADACVFEPYMGPFFKKLPNSVKARTLVKELNEIYSGVFLNLNKSLSKNARVVCILPEYKTNDKKLISINKDVFLKNGFRFVDVSKINEELDLKNPINYSTPDGSVINRTINILEKIN